MKVVNCDAVLSGVEVSLDATEHAADGKQAQRALKSAVAPASAVATLELLGSMS